MDLLRRHPEPPPPEAESVPDQVESAADARGLLERLGARDIGTIAASEASSTSDGLAAA